MRYSAYDTEILLKVYGFSVTGNSTGIIGTLPEGARPKETINLFGFAIMNNTSIMCPFSIDTSGNIRQGYTSNASNTFTQFVIFTTFIR